MAEDRPIAISSSGRLGPDEVARHTFGTARRGFDPAEVRAFLEEVARELSAGHEREQQLQKDAADADERAANPVLDDETLTTALGQETARVLHAAHEAASNMLNSAKSEAAELVASAESREAQARAEAEKASAEQAATLQNERDLAHRQAEQEATARLEAARHEAEELLERARVDCRSMVQQAQDLRTKVLTDLTNRRRVLHLQIEQLRAGRERLSETIQGARQSVDDIADELLRAEDEARIAAEAAGRTAAGLPDLEIDETVNLSSPGTDDLADAGPADTTPTGPSSDSPNHGEPGGGHEDATSLRVAGDPSAEAFQTDGETLTDTENGEGRDRQLEDLFARLRASELGDETSSAGSGGDGAPASEESSSDASGSSEHEPAAQGSPARMDRVVVAGHEPPDETAHPTGSTKAEPIAASATASDDEPTLVLERPLQLIRRDELHGPVITGLARRVKRALQDDQNDILDRLRSQGGWKDGVLPELFEHTARYVEASKEMLAEAARGGSTFAGVSIERAQDVSGEAAELASALVGPLRRRLEEDCPTVDPTDDAALVEHVGAAFREWRGDRTERLAGDHATAAFSASAVAGTSRDVTIRWLVDDEGAPCADCEDNALAEDVSPGDPFPTGHPHPPAHSGCRCLLVVRAT
jgi:DivIVA domain-containing protein